MKCSYCNKVILEQLLMREILWPWHLREQELCSDCLCLFQPLGNRGCQCCGKEGELLCEDCRQWQRLYPDYDFYHQALFKYDAHFKEFMQQYKFHGDLRLAQVFRKEVKTALEAFQEYLICPIPLSAERFQERGFNQVTAFLEAADSDYQLILEKKTDTLPQAKKKRQERLLAPQPFQLRGGYPSLAGKKILIVDDVYTTGRTIFHAAELCLAAGAQQVRSFSLAR